MNRESSALLVMTCLFLASCTMVRNRSALDEVMAAQHSPATVEMRTDGFYWMPVERNADEAGIKWKGAYPLVFLPGRIVKAIPVIPSVFYSERDSASATLNTYEHALTNVRRRLPDYLTKSEKGSLDGWGRYQADSLEIEIGYLSYEGLGFPFFNESYGTFSQKGKRFSDTAFMMDSSTFRFEKFPLDSDTAGLRINKPRFRKKRFPSFFWGW